MWRWCARSASFGFGINLEQSLGSDIGVFACLSRNDGKTETYSFSEIERSTAGVSVKGSSWHRDNGLAVSP